MDALPVTTVSDILNGKRLHGRPRPEFVDAFVTACLTAKGAQPDAVPVILERWRQAWRTSPETDHPVPPVRSDDHHDLPDPTDARTAQEFVALLRALKDASGLTYRHIAAKAAAVGDPLPPATMASALARVTLPRETLVRAFTRACGCGPEAVDRWLEVRRRLATAPRDVPERPAAPTPTPTPTPPESESESESESADSPRARRGVQWSGIGVALSAVLLLVVLSASQPGPWSGGPRSPDAAPPPASCSSVLQMGSTGACVREVQEGLVRAGLTMPVDGIYGPYTKMKVIAFQLHNGVPATGVVDEETFRALRAGGPEIDVWPPDRVERRLREVFPEEPDRVVALVRCLSSLDPLWVFGHANGARTWGLFQLTDREVVLDHRADHLAALDPEWNIRTARMIRDRTGDLSRWTCTPGG